MNGEEVLLPILTTWGLPVKKSNIQLQMEVLSPRSMSLETSFEGIMVLNAELQLMKSILTCVFPLSRWVSAVCVTKAMVSSVALFALYAN